MNKIDCQKCTLEDRFELFKESFNEFKLEFKEFRAEIKEELKEIKSNNSVNSTISNVKSVGLVVGSIVVGIISALSIPV